MTTTTGRTRATALAATLAASALLLAACSNPDDATTGSTPPASAAVTVAFSADGLSVGHVHNVALDGAAVLIGTHAGLYRQEPGAAPVRMGEPFDVMGLTRDGQRWLSSGHPGPTPGAPADIGLQESVDRGATWRQVSLSGQADFHRLAASQGTVLGVNAADGQLWRSADAGATWQTHGPGPYDIALDPADPNAALGTTRDGLVASSDGGITWVAVPDAPLLALLAWTDGAVLAVSPDGAVHAPRMPERPGRLRPRPAASRPRWPPTATVWWSSSGRPCGRALTAEPHSPSGSPVWPAELQETR